MNVEETEHQTVRYAVVGLGHIAQSSVLPAFANSRSSKLAALVSDDREKLTRLGEAYDVELRATYDEYDTLLASGEVDAVYIALPNHLHCEYSVRAAMRGVHVLCEKPMAVTTAECERMIAAADDNGVKLMIAYRLHFEEANLTAIELAKNGELGDPRWFESGFSFSVREGDIRLGSPAVGGGPLHDLGVYCINAARCLFRDEPLDVFATAMTGPDPRFQGSDIPVPPPEGGPVATHETVAVTMRFPEYRLASFIVSYGSDEVESYRLAGTKGVLRVEPAFEHAGDLVLTRTELGKVTDTKRFRKRDQFGPELIYFSECILHDEEPEPDGIEGLADVRVVEAALQSIESGQVVRLGELVRERRPSLGQEIHRRPVRPAELVNAEAPHG